MSLDKDTFQSSGARSDRAELWAAAVVVVGVLPLVVTNEWYPILVICLLVYIAYLKTQGRILREHVDELTHWNETLHQRNERLWRKTMRLKQVLENVRFAEMAECETGRDPLDLTQKEWRFVLKQVHPDRHQGDPVATEVTRKILEHLNSR